MCTSCSYEYCAGCLASLLNVRFMRDVLAVYVLPDMLAKVRRSCITALTTIAVGPSHFYHAFRLCCSSQQRGRSQSVFIWHASGALIFNLQALEASCNATVPWQCRPASCSLLCCTWHRCASTDKLLHEDCYIACGVSRTQARVADDRAMSDLMLHVDAG